MPGIQEGRLGRVIDGFYEAAAQPALWRKVLGETSDALGAQGVGLVAYPDAALGTFWSEGIDELVDEFIKDRSHLGNPR